MWRIHRNCSCCNYGLFFHRNAIVFSINISLFYYRRNSEIRSKRAKYWETELLQNFVLIHLWQEKLNIKADVCISQRVCRTRLWAMLLETSPVTSFMMSLFELNLWKFPFLRKILRNKQLIWSEMLNFYLYYLNYQSYELNFVLAFRN